MVDTVGSSRGKEVETGRESEGWGRRKEEKRVRDEITGSEEKDTQNVQGCSDRPARPKVLR